MTDRQSLSHSLKPRVLPRTDRPRAGTARTWSDHYARPAGVQDRPDDSRKIGWGFTSAAASKPFAAPPTWAAERLDQRGPRAHPRCQQRQLSFKATKHSVPHGGSLLVFAPVGRGKALRIPTVRYGPRQCNSGAFHRPMTAQSRRAARMQVARKTDWVSMHFSWCAEGRH